MSVEHSPAREGDAHQSDELGLLIGARAISEFLGLEYNPDPRKSKPVYYLLASGKIDADKFGSGKKATWVSTRSRLRVQFGGANRFTPPPKEQADSAPQRGRRP